MNRNPKIVLGVMAMTLGFTPVARAEVGLDFNVSDFDDRQRRDIGITFEPTSIPNGASANEVPPIPSQSQTAPPILQSEDIQVANLPQSWWEMGSNSPIAIAIGAAEGTRQPNGSKNPAYYWHSDPGNRADNFGTFSYQHLPVSAKTAVVRAKTAGEKRQISATQGLPEIADRQQLKRLKVFHDKLRQQAIAKDMNLTQMELLNGLDLANQSPLAGLNWMGYLDRLELLRDLVEDPDEQILEARTWAYWDPHRHRWAAPGLGNTYDRIRRDQFRRQQAVERAMATWEKPKQPNPSPAMPPSDKLARQMRDREVFCPLCGL